MNMKSFKTITRIAVCTIALGFYVADTSAQESAHVNSIEALKALQTRIQAVSAKVQPATVALTSASSGASGSGVVVNANGLILTAAHVVLDEKDNKNTEMNVIFTDGKAYTGKVLGANLTKDIAMVQLVERKEWPYAEIGNSDIMKVSDHVIAMGHAGGYDPKRKPPVRFGRILSKNRKGFFSSDCTLIGGDSGGPIFDMNGRVIGINSSIGQIWSSNNHAGISTLIEDWEKLSKGDIWGKLVQNPMDDPDSPLIGASLAVTRNKTGMLVLEVMRQTPASKAGMKPGDLLLAIGNEEVKNHEMLNRAMAHRQPGDETVMTIMRNNEIIKLSMTLTRRGDLFKK